MTLSPPLPDDTHDTPQSHGRQQRDGQWRVQWQDQQPNGAVPDGMEYEESKTMDFVAVNNHSESANGSMPQDNLQMHRQQYIQQSVADGKDVVDWKCQIDQQPKLKHAASSSSASSGSSLTFLASLSTENRSGAPSP